MFKKMGLIFGFAVLVVVYASGVRGEEGSWKLEGQAVTADNCNIGCPCILGEAPHHPHCNFVGIFHVTKGKDGEIDLEGTNFAMAGEFTRKKSQDPQAFSYVAYYIDSKATKGQREALRKILTGPAFADLGKPVEVQEVPISVKGFDHFGEVGKTYGGKVGKIAKVDVTPVSGAKVGKPMVIENSAEPMFFWTCLGEAKGSFYSSGGRKFRYEGTSGESHKFSLASGN